jgi:LysM repeat protein
MKVQMTSKTILLFALGGAMALPGWADDELYVVKKSDTLSAIARRNHLSTKSLAQWNSLKDIDDLKVGSKLYIPKDDSRLVRYVVQKGDSLANIAYLYGQTLGRIARLNNLPKPDQIYPGQTLLVPMDPSAGSIDPTQLKEIDRADVTPGRWKNIVIHHSASTKDSPAIMDRYHRRNGMENGLAYHFVIGGGGLRMEDGEFYIGDRWKHQLQGGHVHSEKLNDESIGICLVGNFNDAPPTPKQMQVLADLIGHLMDLCGLTPDDVYTHVGINPVPTQCPGRKFSIKELKMNLPR